MDVSKVKERKRKIRYMNTDKSTLIPFPSHHQTPIAAPSLDLERVKRVNIFKKCNKIEKNNKKWWVTIQRSGLRPGLAWPFSR